MYNDKTCLFNHTEENYRLFRNLEITVGTELLQTNESVKANVKSYNDWNAALNKVLKEGIAKAVKDVKAKFAELDAAAFKLDSCRNEKNATRHRWRRSPVKNRKAARMIPKILPKTAPMPAISWMN